jgi:Ran-binding protein 9/10
LRTLPPPPRLLQTLELLLPLLILLTVLLFLLLVFLVFLLLLRRSRRGAIQLGDVGGPTNLEQEDELEGEGGLEGIEQRWLEEAEETTRVGYLRSKGAPFLLPVYTELSALTPLPSHRHRC